MKITNKLGLILGTALILTFSGCSFLLNNMIESGGGASGSGSDASGSDSSIPQNVRFYYNESDGKMHTEWSSVKKAKYYYTYVNKDYSYVANRAVSPSQIDGTSAVESGSWESDYIYYTAVSAVNKNYEESDLSVIVSCYKPSSTYKLQYPTNLKADNSAAGKVTLTWDAVPGATYYKVYKYTSNSASESTLTSSSSATQSSEIFTTSYTYEMTSKDNTSTTYYFYVQAFDTYYNKSRPNRCVTEGIKFTAPTLTSNAGYSEDTATQITVEPYASYVDYTKYVGNLLSSSSEEYWKFMGSANTRYYIDVQEYNHSPTYYKKLNAGVTANVDIYVKGPNASTYGSSHGNNFYIDVGSTPGYVYIKVKPYSSTYCGTYGIGVNKNDYN